MLHRESKLAPVLLTVLWLTDHFATGCARIPSLSYWGFPCPISSPFYEDTFLESPCLPPSASASHSFTQPSSLRWYTMKRIMRPVFGLDGLVDLCLNCIPYTCESTRPRSRMRVGVIKSWSWTFGWENKQIQRSAFSLFSVQNYGYLSHD